MIIAGFECTECFVHQINKVISIACKNKNEIEKIEIFKQAIKFLSGIDFNNSPPEIARQIYNYLYKLTGNLDPFKEIKKQTNEIARTLAEKIFSEKLSLEDYLKYAIAGNVIDFGIAGNEFDINMIKNFTLYINHFDIFLSLLKKRKTLLYIVDNSGEIIFDFYFLQKINREFPNVEIFVAGREKNIINDITKDDLINLDFPKYFKVVSTGYSGAGVLIDSCSSDFRRLFSEVDIVIAKGQGNFETLFGEKNNHIFYAFKVKCNHVSKITNITKGANVFVYNFKMRDIE